MGYIKIKKSNTTGKTPPAYYDSWLEFWEKEKGRKAAHCRVEGCRGIADVGGHFIKDGEGAKEYILPICKWCIYKYDREPDWTVLKAWEGNLVPVPD